MAMRKLLARGLPEPPATAPGATDLVAEIFNQPLLAPVRIFWGSLNDMRPWWPILLPLLALVGWRTYRRERARVLAQRNSP
jgi:hypothetical protein